ncbi:MAG TPA: hypothetical protein PK095_15780, partial [Myxococcota bacterium]|nr:hypothetical protein [Myxococcota bacterium]
MKAALGKLKDEGRPSRRDAMRFAPDMTGSRLSKFLPCLPDELARELHVEKLVDLATARRMVGLEPEVGEGGVEGEGGGRAEALGAVVWVRDAEALGRVVAELMGEPVVGLAVQTALEGVERAARQRRAFFVKIDPDVDPDSPAGQQVLAALEAGDVVDFLF